MQGAIGPGARDRGLALDNLMFIMIFPASFVQILIPENNVLKLVSCVPRLSNCGPNDLKSVVNYWKL